MRGRTTSLLLRFESGFQKGLQHRRIANVMRAKSSSTQLWSRDNRLVKVTVVGGGIIGCAVAHALASRGASVRDRRHARAGLGRDAGIRRNPRSVHRRTYRRASCGLA